MTPPIADRRVARWGALALVVACTVSVFTSLPGSLVADARYEHSADPIQFLERHRSLWDDERTLGEPAQYFSPALASFQAGAQLIGAAPWVIQRLTHALLLAVAGLGMSALMRRLVRDDPAAVLSAFLYTFNPYTFQYLEPSGLFVAYAIAPWLVRCALGGAEEHDRWRWAAGFAVAVFAMGMLNTPALGYTLLPSVVIVGAHIRLSPSASWRSAAGWAWRAALLTAGVSAAMLVVLAAASPELRVVLETTETPETIARNSSSSESWRGLGFWLSYFREGSGSLREQVEPYFTNPGVMAVSFAAPALAGLALLMRRRLAGAFALLAGTGIVVMVGLHPPDDPSPWGRALRWTFDRSTEALGFRTTYKAGVAVQMAVAAMAAIGLAALYRPAASDPRPARSAVQRGLAGALLVAVVVAAFPFWTGRLYEPDERIDGLPSYWDEAFDWFDEQPSDPGVLVLPSAARTRYRWGFVNDTLFDAHLRQRAVGAQTLPQSTAVLADLTESVDEYLASSRYEAGTLGPILRRMGVRWVLFQNDVAWEATAAARPSTYDGLRSDPDLRRVAGFGDPGANVVPAIGLAPAFADERDLQPVEVYEVVDPRPAGGVVSDRAIVVAGGGEAWPALASAGWLDWPVVHAAELDARSRPAVAAGTAGVVLTDGGQRRATRAASFVSSRSRVLGADEDVDRSAQPLFDGFDNQTVATYSDVARIVESEPPSQSRRWSGAGRPALAMDGNAETAWFTNAPRPVVGIEPIAPVDVEVVTVVPLEPTEGVAPLRRVEVRVQTTDGQTSVFTAAAEPRTDIVVGIDDVEGVEIELEVGADPDGDRVGVAEIEILTPDGRLDGREYLRTPAPAELQSLVAADGDLAVQYLFTRYTGARGAQADLRRELWSPGTRPLDVDATFRVDDATPDRVVDDLLGAEVGAFATSRAAGSIEGTGLSVLDDDPATAWHVDPEDPGELTVRLDGRVVDQVEIHTVLVADLPVRFSRVTGFEVVVSGGDRDVPTTVELPDEPVCAAGIGPSDWCMERVVVDIDPQEADRVTVRPTTVDTGAEGFGSPPPQVARVVLREGGRDALTAQSTEPAAGCRPLVEVDGEEITVRPRGDLSLGSLTEGVRFESCEPLELDAGWHRVANRPGLVHAMADLSIGPGPVDPPPPVRAVRVESSTSSRQRLVAEVDPGDLVVTSVPFHEGWQVDASLPGRATSADGFVAWRAEGAGTVRLDLSFGPQRIYKLAWVLTAVTLAVCLWLLIPRSWAPWSLAGRRER